MVNGKSRFSWSSSELEEVQKASLLLAADVVYSDDLTDALFGILERLMSQGSEKVWLTWSNGHLPVYDVGNNTQVDFTNECHS